MSKVKQMFDEHLSYVRSIAKADGIEVIKLLFRLVDPPLNALARPRTERQLIEAYRLQFYEDVANEGFAEAGRLDRLAEKKAHETRRDQSRRAAKNIRFKDDLAKLVYRTVEALQKKGSAEPACPEIVSRLGDHDTDRILRPGRRTYLKNDTVGWFDAKIGKTRRDSYDRFHSRRRTALRQLAKAATKK